MRPLLLALIYCSVATLVRAQNPVPKLIKIQPGRSIELRNGNFFSKPFIDSLGVVSGPSFLQNKKPGVYRLRQDNMPCIVPDTKDIAAIPNGWKGKSDVPFVGAQPRIPNLAPWQSFRYPAK